MNGRYIILIRQTARAYTVSSRVYIKQQEKVSLIHYCKNWNLNEVKSFNNSKIKHSWYQPLLATLYFRISALKNKDKRRIYLCVHWPVIKASGSSGKGNLGLANSLWISNHNVIWGKLAIVKYRAFCFPTFHSVYLCPSQTWCFITPRWYKGINTAHNSNITPPSVK